MSNQIGSDVFLEDIGKHDQFNCPVCGANCTVQRNTGVKFIKSSCDIFRCPNAGEKWHYKVASLKQFIKKYPSKGLQKIVEQDIERLLRMR